MRLRSNALLIIVKKRPLRRKIFQLFLQRSQSLRIRGAALHLRVDPHAARPRTRFRRHVRHRKAQSLRNGGSGTIHKHKSTKWFATLDFDCFSLVCQKRTQK